MERKEIQKIIDDGVRRINIQDVFSPGWKVDKAKIKYLVRNRKEIDDLMYCLSVDSRVNSQFTSTSLKNSHYNFTIECKKGTVYVGLEDNSNMNTEESRKTVTVEYNPYKVDIFNEVTYLSKFKWTELHRRYILYLDLAYDMYINISDLRYKKRRKNEYRSLHEHSFLETIYLKRFGTTNAVRIYDKTKEMNSTKNEDIDEDSGEITQEKYYGDCTRYEIRIKPEGKNQQLMMNLIDPFFIQSIVNLHELWLDDGTEEKILKEIRKYRGNDFANLMMVHQGEFDYFTSNRTKKKYIDIYQDIKKSFSKSQHENDIFKMYDTDCIYKTIKNYLDNITSESSSQDNTMLIATIMDIQNRKGIK